VSVRTRRGHPITDSVPGIGALAGLGRWVVLDGELVAGAGTASDFYGLLPHLVRRRHPGPPAPVSFWAFDLLWIDDEPLLDRPYLERRR
jgi:ATP-dependent DNA ligase